jgi:hypothetical protein
MSSITKTYHIDYINDTYHQSTVFHCELHHHHHRHQITIIIIRIRKRQLQHPSCYKYNPFSTTIIQSKEPHHHHHTYIQSMNQLYGY